MDWEPIETGTGGLGRLAFYYSSQDSPLPVRAVRKRWDNKADPNIETATWGLFSTCMPSTRKGIVERGDSYLFFFTNWKGERRVTGYYELGWYAYTGIRVRDRRGTLAFPDLAIRAKNVRFVEDGLILRGVNSKASKVAPKLLRKGELSGYGPRESTQANAQLSALIKSELDKKVDVTRDYVKEIHALEIENLDSTGFKYPSWKRKEGFNSGAMEEFVNW